MSQQHSASQHTAGSWCFALIAMTEHHACLSGALKAAGIPFHEADSTMMIWVDLRRYLEAPTWEAEQKLWHRLADEQRVILTPGGQACVLHWTGLCTAAWEAYAGCCLCLATSSRC